MSGSFTADDELTLYLSTDLVASASEQIWNKTSNWGATESFSGVSLAPGQSVYLLVDARNVHGGPAMFLGEFQLAGSDFQFANGGNSLVSDTVHWTVSEASFAAANAQPVSLGSNAGLQIRGQRPGIASHAEAVWAYYADWAQGCNGHAYFVTQISAVPEPATAALWLLGIAGLGTLTRRRARR